MRFGPCLHQRNPGTANDVLASLRRRWDPNGSPRRNAHRTGIGETVVVGCHKTDHTLGDRERRYGIGTRKEQDKLVGFVATKHVVLATTACEKLRYLLEHLVADGGPESVIQVVHVVDIETQDRVAVPGARTASMLSFELLAKATKVDEAGQRIDRGQLVQAGLELTLRTFGAPLAGDVAQ